MHNYIVDQLANWPLRVNFVSLEELHVTIWAAGNSRTHANPLLRSVVSPCLRRVILELSQRKIRLIQWPLLDETLVNLVERHRAYENLELQISAKMDLKRIRQSLPRVAQVCVC